MYKQLISLVIPVLLSLTQAKAQDIGKAQKIFYHEHCKQQKQHLKKCCNRGILVDRNITAISAT